MNFQFNTVYTPALYHVEIFTDHDFYPIKDVVRDQRTDKLVREDEESSRDKSSWKNTFGKNETSGSFELKSVIM